MCIYLLQWTQSYNVFSLHKSFIKLIIPKMCIISRYRKRGPMFCHCKRSTHHAASELLPHSQHNHSRLSDQVVVCLCVPPQPACTHAGPCVHRACVHTTPRVNPVSVYSDEATPPFDVVVQVRIMPAVVFAVHASMRQGCRGNASLDANVFPLCFSQIHRAASRLLYWLQPWLLCFDEAVIAV